MYQTDVKSTNLSASGVVIGSPARIKGVWAVGVAGANTLTFYNNATTNSGSTPLVLNIPAGAGGGFWLSIPGEGVLCQNGIYLAMGSSANVTVFYG